MNSPKRVAILNGVEQSIITPVRGKTLKILLWSEKKRPHVLIPRAVLSVYFCIRKHAGGRGEVTINKSLMRNAPALPPCPPLPFARGASRNYILTIYGRGVWRKFSMYCNVLRPPELAAAFHSLMRIPSSSSSPRWPSSFRISLSIWFGPAAIIIGSPSRLSDGVTALRAA